MAVAVEGIQGRDRYLVYNLDVDRVDTFFVATLGILVHNCIDPKNLPRPQRRAVRFLTKRLREHRRKLEEEQIEEIITGGGR